MTDELHVVLGSGPAGTTLAKELVRRGHRVRLVDRAGNGTLIDGVERFTADVSTEEGADRAVAGAHVAYHCVNVGYHLQTAVMPVVQKCILAAVERIGARLVVLDTLYPYGPTGGAVMTEDTPWNATSAKGRMRAELDQVYLDTHREGRVGIALGRSADFVGPGVTNSSLAAAVFPAALTGGEVYALGDIELAHSYTDIREVAAGLATLGEHPDSDGRIWHLPTAPAITTRAVLDTIAELTGRSLDVNVIAELKPFGPFDEQFVSAYAEMFYQHTEPQVMDSSAFERHFDVAPRSLRTTLDDTLNWYCEQFLATKEL